MKFRVLIVLVTVFFISNFVSISITNAQQIIEEDVIKVKRRYPSGPSKVYLGSGGKKKKVKSKIKVVNNDNCPTYVAYFSKPKAKREKKLRKHKRR